MTMQTQNRLQIFPKYFVEPNERRKASDAERNDERIQTELAPNVAAQPCIEGIDTARSLQDPTPVDVLGERADLAA